MELLEAIAGGVLAALLIGWIGTRPYGFGGASREDPELLEGAGVVEPRRDLMAPTRPHLAPRPRPAIRRSHPRQERSRPLVAHAGICAVGRQQRPTTTFVHSDTVPLKQCLGRLRRSSSCPEDPSSWGGYGEKRACMRHIAVGEASISL